MHKIGVRDSKMLSKERRSKLYKDIAGICLEIKVDKITAKEINEAMASHISINELEAMRFARLIDRLDSKVERIYLDSPDVIQERFGIRVSEYARSPLYIKGVKRAGSVEKGDRRVRVFAEHKADSKYPVVSAASIVAKIVRDREVRGIERRLRIKVGSGYPSDSRTIDAIRENLNNDRLSEHIRDRWSTMNRVRQTDLMSFYNK